MPSGGGHIIRARCTVWDAVLIAAGVAAARAIASHALSFLGHMHWGETLRASGEKTAGLRAQFTKAVCV